MDQRERDFDNLSYEEKVAVRLRYKNIAQWHKQYRKERLQGLLDQCTLSQKEVFNRMYSSIDTIADAQIDWATEQVNRTLAKNALEK